MTLSDASVTADRIVLISNPNENDDIEGSRAVVEELGHYSFHALNRP
jgi:hypothetical protein